MREMFRKDQNLIWNFWKKVEKLEHALLSRESEIRGLDKELTSSEVKRKDLQTTFEINIGSLKYQKADGKGKLKNGIE